MSITIKKIAEISGVSRGTVDRVLNNRGKVHPDKEKLVRECAKMLGYTPNIAGKTLAVAKRNHVIGIILNSKDNVFFDDMIEEINAEIENFKSYGIKTIVKIMKGYEVDTQLKLISEIENDITALIITPVDDEKISQKIDELIERNICVVTLNNDIENSNRMCYVGSDYYDGGKIAAGVVKLIKPSGANLGIVQGSNKLYGHNLRIKGFKDEIPKEYIICNIIESQDDDIIAYTKTLKMINDNESLDTIFIVAAGVYGVCRAVIDSKREITLFCFDDTKTNIELLKEGLIKVIISQQSRLQGKKVMQIIFDYFVTNEIVDEFIVENQIKIKQNYM